MACQAGILTGCLNLRNILQDGEAEGIKSITHCVHQSPLQKTSICTSDTALLSKSAFQ